VGARECDCVLPCAGFPSAKQTRDASAFNMKLTKPYLAAHSWLLLQPLDVPGLSRAPYATNTSPHGSISFVDSQLTSGGINVICLPTRSPNDYPPRSFNILGARTRSQATSRRVLGIIDLAPCIHSDNLAFGQGVLGAAKQIGKKKQGPPVPILAMMPSLRQTNRTCLC
jgi:hypothetical protein